MIFLKTRTNYQVTKSSLLAFWEPTGTGAPAAMLGRLNEYKNIQYLNKYAKRKTLPLLINSENILIHVDEAEALLV